MPRRWGILQNVKEKLNGLEKLEMLKICSELFSKWLDDLTLEEQKIWLWNAKAEMVKIKRGR